MKKLVPTMIAFVVIVCSCQTPAQKCSGTYNGQYTNNSTVLNGINTSVTEEGDKQVSVTFNVGSPSAITVSGINITSDGNNFALTKTEFTGAFSGSVSGNELNVGYSSMAGAISFVGTK